MRHLFRLVWVLGIIGAVLGCGGSGLIKTPVTLGRATFTVEWPTDTRLIPLASNSIRVTLWQGTESITSQLLVRPNSGGSTTADFSNLPIGDMVATAQAYPTQIGTGTAQASASVPLSTQVGQTTPIHLTMASTVASVTINPDQNLFVGINIPVAFTAKDAKGNVVLVSSKEAHITAVRSAETVSISDGQVRGRRRGSVGLQLTVQGVTSSVQTIPVILAPGTPWVWGENTNKRLGPLTILLPPNQTALTDITQIAGAVEHTLWLKRDGTVLFCGNTYSGQDGINGIFIDRDIPVPTLIPGLNNVVQVSARGWYSRALLSDGTMWSWGGMYAGDGSTAPHAYPTQVPGLNNVASIGGGDAYLALLTDGTVWAWGYNKYGAVGDGTTVDRLSPVQITGLPPIVQIDGGSHSVALAADGTVWVWGINDFGQLGLGTRDTNPHSIPTQVPGLTNVVAISANDGATSVLKSDGTVWCWGGNSNGELGDGTYTQRTSPVQAVGLSNVVSISHGGTHLLALLADGSVWSCGENDGHELGNIPPSRALPHQIPNFGPAYAVFTTNRASYALTFGTGIGSTQKGVRKTALSLPPSPAVLRKGR